MRRRWIANTRVGAHASGNTALAVLAFIAGFSMPHDRHAHVSASRRYHGYLIIARNSGDDDTRFIISRW